MILLDLHGVLLNLQPPLLTTRDYWFYMPKYPWFHELINLCLDFDDVTICTAPNEYNIGYMFDWHQDVLPNLPIIFTTEKHLCQGILIDDDHDGAHQPDILFPQPYNFNRDLVGYELSYVEHELERIYE